MPGALSSEAHAGRVGITALHTVAGDAHLGTRSRCPSSGTKSRSVPRGHGHVASNTNRLLEKALVTERNHQLSSGNFNSLLCSNVLVVLVQFLISAILSLAAEGRSSRLHRKHVRKPR